MEQKFKVGQTVYRTEKGLEDLRVVSGSIVKIVLDSQKNIIYALSNSSGKMFDESTLFKDVGDLFQDKMRKIKTLSDEVIFEFIEHRKGEK